MSKSYSPSSAPEFAAQNEYSGLLYPSESAAPAQQQSPTLNIVAADIAAPSLTSQDLALKQCDRGSKALARQDYAQARSAYKAAVEWHPNLAIAHSGLAHVCYEVQDYEGALTSCNLAISCDPAQTEFYYQRALVNKVFKNYYEVLVDCHKILTQEPNHPSAAWLNAVALVKTGKYQAALPGLDQHILAYPQDPNGYCYRGICSERLGKLTQALADFDQAIELQPNHHVFHHARGRTRQKLGDLPGALADLDITVKRKPQAIVYDERAEIQRCLGNNDQAIQDCSLAISLNAKFVSAYFRRGLIYTEQANLDLALADYNSTIEIDPGHGDAYIQRAWIWFRQANYAQVKQDCQMVQTLTPACFWAYYLLGVTDSLSASYQNAIKNFSTAIEISDNYVSARYHRGLAYAELGDIQTATAEFEQARAIQSRGSERLVDRDETGFYAEGLALQHLGQPEVARKVLLFGALAAKRFNNPSFHQLIQSKIAALESNTGDLSQNPPV
jgi:tetratricopeptide (TPR) repeat protein